MYQYNAEDTCWLSLKCNNNTYKHNTCKKNCILKRGLCTLQNVAISTRCVKMFMIGINLKISVQAVSKQPTYIHTVHHFYDPALCS